MRTVRIRKARLSDLNSLTGLWHGLVKHHLDEIEISSTNLRTKRRSHGLERTKDKSQYKLSKDAERKWRKWASKWIRSKDGLVLVAEDNGKLVAYSMNFIKKNVPVYNLQKLGCLSDLFVGKNYRKRGIATKFFRLAMRWFKRKKVKTASIAFHIINPAAGKLYREWGFREFHIEMRRKI